jgi:hypothetical protein
VENRERGMQPKPTDRSGIGTARRNRLRCNRTHLLGGTHFKSLCDSSGTGAKISEYPEVSLRAFGRLAVDVNANAHAVSVATN